MYMEGVATVAAAEMGAGGRWSKQGRWLEVVDKGKPWLGRWCPVGLRRGMEWGLVKGRRGSLV